MITALEYESAGRLVKIFLIIHVMTILIVLADEN